MKIDSILEDDEHVIQQLNGGLRLSNGTRKGEWFVTNQRLIFKPATEIKYTLKDAIWGGLLSAFLRARKEASGYQEYRFRDLISIGVDDGQPNLLNAIFKSDMPWDLQSGQKKTVKIKVDNPKTIIKLMKDAQKSKT